MNLSCSDNKVKEIMDSHKPICNDKSCSRCRWNPANTQPETGTSEETQPKTGISEETLSKIGAVEESQSKIGTAEETQPKIGTSEEPQSKIETSEDTQPDIGTSGERKHKNGTAEESQPKIGISEEIQSTIGTSEETQSIIGTAEANQPQLGSCETQDQVIIKVYDSDKEDEVLGNPPARKENFKESFPVQEESQVPIRTGHKESLKKNFGYIIEHLNFVDTIGQQLFDERILTENMKLDIEKKLLKDGPTAATDQLLEVLLRDPDPGHHEIFYKSLEETGQQLLANVLRGSECCDLNRGPERDTAVASVKFQRKQKLANPDNLNPELIKEDLCKGTTPSSVAIGCVSESIVRTLLCLDLDRLYSKLQESQILTPAELIELTNSREVKKRNSIRLLNVFLQGKTLVKIKHLCHVLRGIEGTEKLADLIEIVLNKCQHIDQELKATQESEKGKNDHPNEGVYILPIQLDTKFRGGNISLSEIVRLVEKDPQVFQATVICVKGENLRAESKCIQISLSLKSYWDLENLQKSVACGLYSERLRSWMSENGHHIHPQTTMETTLILAREESDSHKEEIKRILAHHVEDQSSATSSSMHINKSSQTDRLVENKMTQTLDNSMDISPAISLRHSSKHGLEKEPELESLAKKTCNDMPERSGSTSTKIYSSSIEISENSGLGHESSSFINRSILHRGQETKVVPRIYRLQQYHNKIWCISGKLLHTYSLDCDHLGRLEVQVVKSGRALVATNTRLLVADINIGIHLLTHEGHHLQKVVEGRFSDICMYNQKAFTLEYTKGIVYVLVETERDIWDVQKQITLAEYKDGSVMDTLIQNENLYVANSLQNTVYIYNQEKQQVFDRSTYDPNKYTLNNPRLCDVDSEGNVIVTCVLDKRLFMLTKAGEWSDICLNDVKGNLVDITTDHKGENIWILEGHPSYALAKYCKS